MLQSLRLTDFKSFVDEQVDLAPLTMLVGANASGKSNFLDAVRFLHGIAFELTLGEIINGERSERPNAWFGIRGGAGEVARVGAGVIHLESQWKVGCRKFWHRMSCATTPTPHLVEEDFEGPDGVLIAARSASGALIGTIHGAEYRTSPPPVTSLLKYARHETAQCFLRALEAISFLDIQPARMRGYGRRGAPLGDQGENFSGVLADLCANPEERRALVDWLAELCAPELEDLDFIEVKELGDVMAVLVEKGKRRITARSLSDGTLHFLGMLLALRTAERGSILVIEEVGAGLHPTRIRLLVEALETATRERGIQILATTHSSVVLQWLSEQTLQDAVVFGRVPEHEGTIMRRLGDLPHLRETLEMKGIDELFSTGWLEMAL